jgi:hypothetical protein
MSETSEIAQTVEQLSEQTRRLVRQEINAMRAEMWERAKAAAPATAAFGAAGLLSLFAVASAYRTVARTFDKALPPFTSALVSTLAFAAGAAGAAFAGVRLLEQTPAPVPADTVRHTREAAEAHT